jgi:hypothetical protein
MSTYKKFQNYIAQPTYVSLSDMDNMENVQKLRKLENLYNYNMAQPIDIDGNPTYVSLPEFTQIQNLENYKNLQNYDKAQRDIYCGEPAGASAYANKETTMGTRSQCLEKGKYVAYRNTDYKFKKPIYCGTDTTLPDNYQSMGTIEQCFNRGGIHARYEDLHD